MINRARISVIVPFYNSEKTILRCIHSILIAKKRIPIEILCIDDGSTDRSREIVYELMALHRQVKLITHAKNRGLFQARMTGVNHARGKYIGFVDSDDYIQTGYFENLRHIAQAKKADVVVGRIVNVSPENVHYMQTRCLDFPYTKEAGLHNYYDLYWKQAGLCYPWHVLWNKLYTRKLWRQSLEMLTEINVEFTMLEDFVLSSIVLSQAKCYAAAKNAHYYYTQSSDNTISQQGSFEKWEKNINDMSIAFSIVETFLAQNTKWNQYLEFFEKWKQRYSRYWTGNIESVLLFSESEKEKLLYLLGEKLSVKELNRPTEDDKYYYEMAEFGEEVP